MRRFERPVGLWLALKRAHAALPVAVPPVRPMTPADQQRPTASPPQNVPDVVTQIRRNLERTGLAILLAALLSGCPDVDVHEDRERGVTCWSRIVGSSVAMSCLPDLMLLPRRDGGEP